MGCQNQECNCEVDSEILIQNDSLVNDLLKDNQNGFESYWKRFNEPVIYKGNNESYRFSIVVLLYDYMKIYRVDKNKNDFKLSVKEYAVSTTTRGREDSLVSNYSQAISKSDWLSFKNSINENCFWTLPVDIKSDDGYLDGSSWVLEGKHSNNPCTKSDYHYAFRNSPDSSAFLNICESFIKFDSLKVKSYHPK